MQTCGILYEFISFMSLCVCMKPLVMLLKILLGCGLVVIVLISQNFLNVKSSVEKRAANKIYACSFEVFGRVQGVFFRKYTEKQAKQLGLHGWCMNTREGTVKGELEGALNAINEMKQWLQSKGSPLSRIDKAVFSETNEIPAHKFTTFGIKR